MKKRHVLIGILLSFAVVLIGIFLATISRDPIVSAPNSAAHTSLAPDAATTNQGGDSSRDNSVQSGVQLQ